MAQSYQDLVAWQKAMDLLVAVYAATASFPKSEIYGLTSQMRRAAVSVPSCIAEGHGRSTRGEFYQSLGQSRGSLLELQTQILAAQRLHYLTEADGRSLLELSYEEGRILNGLMNSVERQKLRLTR